MKLKKTRIQKHKTTANTKGLASAVLRKAIIHSGNGECQDCGWKEEITVLQHHHREPKKKQFTIPYGCKRVVSQKMDIEQLMTEVDKCDLLCPTCHTMRHFHTRQASIASPKNAIREILAAKNCEGSSKR